VPERSPTLTALAPTQSEPPFAIAQGVVLIAFSVGGRAGRARSFVRRVDFRVALEKTVGRKPVHDSCPHQPRDTEGPELVLAALGRQLARLHQPSSMIILVWPCKRGTGAPTFAFRRGQNSDRRQ